jgi:4-amino-4-deoxy-L-arabinose transferase-like glycosyltransferase
MKKLLNKIKQEKIVIIIFFLAILSGLFWNHRYFFIPVPQGDEMQYSCIATTLLESGEYSDCGYTMNREPVYPFFIAGMYAISNSHPDSVRYAQLIIFGLICALTYLFAKKIFDEKIALYASLFLASWWALANYTGRYTRELLMAFFFILLIQVLYLFFKKQKIKYIVSIGALLGLLVLLNSVTQFLIIFIIVNFIFVYRKRLSLKNITFYILTMIFVFSLVLSPWMIRNKEKYGVLGVSAVPTTGFILSYRASVMERLYPKIYKYFYGHLFGYYFAEKLWPDMDILLFRHNDIIDERKELLAQGKNIFEVDNINIFSLASLAIILSTSNMFLP